MRKGNMVAYCEMCHKNIDANEMAEVAIKPLPNKEAEYVYFLCSKCACKIMKAIEKQR